MDTAEYRRLPGVEGHHRSAVCLPVQTSFDHYIPRWPVSPSVRFATASMVAAIEHREVVEVAAYPGVTAPTIFAPARSSFEYEGRVSSDPMLLLELSLHLAYASQYARGYQIE